MNVDRNTREPVWYRQFWPWFLIALPASAVVAGLFTLYLAIVSDDGLVADDYYKRGLAINTDLGRYQRAKDLGLWAGLAFDFHGEQPGSVVVRLQSNKVDQVPQLSMKMKLVHPTEPGRDQIIVLQAQPDGSYRGSVATPENAYWHINLDSAGGEWRIIGRAHLPQQPQATLTSE